MTPEVGDQIELVFMDDPYPVRPGTRGVVVRSTPVGWGSHRFTQVDVEWENGRRLMLTVPPDVVRILSRGNPPQPDHVWDQIFRDLIDNGLTISEAARRYDVTAQAISARLKKRPFLQRLYFSLPHAHRPYEGPDMDAGGPPIGINPRSIDRRYGADRPRRRRREESAPCAVCGEPTRHGKKYCPEHLEESSYAARLMERMEAQEREVAKVRQRGRAAIAEDSDVLADILDALEARDGTASIKQLTAEFPALGEKVIEKYVKQAIADGMAYWTFQGREGMKKVTIDYALRYVRTGEMANLAGIGRKRIRALAKEHGAPHKKDGRDLLWNPEEFLAWHDEYLERVYDREGYLRRRGLFTTNGLSEELGISPSHLHKLAREEGAPHERMEGNALAWDKDKFMKWHEGYRERQREKFSKGLRESYKKRARARRKSRRNLTRREIAEELGVSIVTINYWVANADVPHDVVGDTGRPDKKIRLFDADEVREWYKGYKDLYEAQRREGRKIHSEEKYEELFDYIRAGHTILEAEEKFGVSEGHIYKAMADRGVEFEPPRGERLLTREQVAAELGVKPVTIFAWVKKGVPHDRMPKTGTSKREILLFDADEVREWRERYSKLPKTKPGPAKKKTSKKVKKRAAKKKAAKKKASKKKVKKRATKKKAKKKRSTKR